MTRVPLRNVCAQSREQIRPGQCVELKYVGLESIEPGTGEFITGELSKTPEDPRAVSFRFDTRHVLYGKLRPYLNKVVAPEFEGKCSTELIPLLPSEALDRRYLAYFLRNPATVQSITGRTAGARMPRADMDFLLDLEITLPPLPEQRRLVDLISRAEGIVRLRHEAQAKAAELVPAMFLDMFGDPASNPKEWPVVAFADICETQLGKMLDKKKQTGLCAFPYLGNSNVRWNDFDLDGLLEMDFNEPERAKFELRPGDLLVCEGGEVGRAAIWKGQLQNCYFQKALHRVRPTPSLALPEFILWWLWLKSKHGQLESAGAKATIAHLPAEKLRALKVALPPIDLQHQFATKTEAVRAIATQQSAALATAQATFDALLHQAFATT